MTRKRRAAIRLEDVIAPFRAIEANEDALVILGDDQAMKVLVAWTHVDNEWEPSATALVPYKLGRAAAAWAWIVQGWMIDSDEVARFAGIASGIAHAKLEILIGNRLIYPDGSVSKGARIAMSAYTAATLGLKPGKSDKATTTSKKKPPAPDGGGDATN